LADALAGQLDIWDKRLWRAEKNYEALNYNVMKKSLFTLALAAIHMTAFAQAKVTLGNDASHLVVFTGDTFALPPEYRPYAGQPVPQMGTPDDQFQYLTVELLAGLTPISLTLESTLAPAGQAGLADGRIANQEVILTDIPAGDAFFQIQIWETGYGSFANAVANNRPVGTTPVFQATAGDFTPTPLVSSPDWIASPVILAPIPEPSTYALLAMGLGALWLIRRRKY
jgi:hypothetical protein